MFSDKYKRDNEKINLDKSFKDSLGEKMKRGTIKMEKNNKKLKGVIAAAAAMAIIVGGYFITNGGNKIENTDSVVSSGLEETKPQGGNEISSGEVSGTSMMSFLQYNGNNYRYTYHHMTLEKANEIKGEKIGTTVMAEGGNKQFGSHMAGIDIYDVKGYDDKSVLLGILTTETDTIIDVYSYYDENEIKTGQDILSKMNIEGNIKSIKVINNMGNVQEKDVTSEFFNLLSDFKIAKNQLENKEFIAKFNSDYTKEVKSLEVELKDGIVRNFDFYKDGFMFIDGYIFDLPNKENGLEIYNKL